MSTYTILLRIQRAFRKWRLRVHPELRPIRLASTDSDYYYAGTNPSNEFEVDDDDEHGTNAYDADDLPVKTSDGYGQQEDEFVIDEKMIESALQSDDEVDGAHADATPSTPAHAPEGQSPDTPRTDPEKVQNLLNAAESLIKAVESDIIGDDELENGPDSLTAMMSAHVQALRREDSPRSMSPRSSSRLVNSSPSAAAPLKSSSPFYAGNATLSDAVRKY